MAVAIYVFVTVNNAGDIKFDDAYRINLFDRYDKGKEEKELVDTIQDTVRLSFIMHLIYLFMCNILLHCHANISHFSYLNLNLNLRGSIHRLVNRSIFKREIYFCS